MDYDFVDSIALPSLGAKSVLIPGTLGTKDKKEPVTIRSNDDGSYYVPVNDAVDRMPKYYLKFRCPKIKAKLDTLIGDADARINCECYSISKDGKTGYLRFKTKATK
tara:strand:+ start:2105 stop:2425 length:321 start_codon:yes stop_codon:yes gene_type:complete